MNSMKNIWNAYFDWPPVWLLICMFAAWWLSIIWNPVSYLSQATTTIGWLAIFAGIGLMGLSFVMFLQHKTSVVPKRTPNSIISSGPYKYSRNPIYLADVIVLIGYIMTLGSVISFVLVPLFISVIQKRFITGEEIGIRAEFGSEYDNYCAKTRRWI